MIAKPSRSLGLKRRRSTRARSASGAILDGALLQRAAHLLKNHATAMRNASHLLLLPDAPADQSMRDRWRSALRDSGTGMLQLLVQLECLGDSLRPDPAALASVPLADWIRDRVREARVAEPASDVALTIGRLPAGTWRFATAPAALALGCLLRNALTHPPAGARASVASRMVPGGLLLVVADNGAGVPANESPLLFTPFFRGEASLDRPGAGLGLVIARAAAARAGGHVSHHPVAPRGARFELFVRGTRLPPS